MRRIAFLCALWQAAPAVADEGPLAAIAAHPGGLTADEVARHAASTSIEARVRAEDVRAAAAGVDQALTAFFPRLTLTARYVRLSPAPGASLQVLFKDLPDPFKALIPDQPLSPVLLNSTTFQASLLLPISDYLLRMVQGWTAAGYSVRAAKLGEEAARWKAATDGRLLYYGWVRARGATAVVEQGLALARAHLADVENMLAQGMVSQADRMRVDSQVAQAELLVERTRNLSALLEEQLRVVMHDRTKRGYEVGEDVTRPPPPEAALPIDELVSEAESRRLELKALRETRRVIDRQVKIARAAAFPRLDAFADASYVNPNQRLFPAEDKFGALWDVGAQMTWTPNDVGYAVAGVRAAQSKAGQIAAQEAGLRDGIRVEVIQAQLALREAQVALTTTARGLASAEESYRVRRELFRNGKATSVELSDAESDVTRARLEAIGARVELRVARVKLDHATGRDVVPGGG
ncbi:MAG: TolC family protein [Myxococcales bacterium]|nr:TolC family protein [Myxococcales bacterium]